MRNIFGTSTDLYGPQLISTLHPDILSLINFLICCSNKNLLVHSRRPPFSPPIYFGFHINFLWGVPCLALISVTSMPEPIMGKPMTPAHTVSVTYILVQVTSPRFTQICICQPAQTRGWAAGWAMWWLPRPGFEPRSTNSELTVPYTSQRHMRS